MSREAFLDIPMPGLFDTFCLKERHPAEPYRSVSDVSVHVRRWCRKRLAPSALRVTCSRWAGLVTLEATAVSPEGRISWEMPACGMTNKPMHLSPLYNRSNTGGKPGIQLAHAGRKASANRPWRVTITYRKESRIHGRRLLPLRFHSGQICRGSPEEMSLQDIARVQLAMVDAAARARDVGFEWLQLHFAHGYLAQNFWSPLSNRRTDQYGGSAENRGRYLLEP